MNGTPVDILSNYFKNDINQDAIDFIGDLKEKDGK